MAEFRGLRRFYASMALPLLAILSWPVAVDAGRPVADCRVEGQREGGQQAEIGQALTASSSWSRPSQQRTLRQ